GRTPRAASSGARTAAPIRRSGLRHHASASASGASALRMTQGQLHSRDVARLSKRLTGQGYLRLTGNAVVLSAIGGSGRDVYLSPAERRVDTNDGGFYGHSTSGRRRRAT